MIAAKEALLLGGVAVVAYLAFKPTEGEGFGGAGGEGVEKKEPSEAGDVIYNIPEPVDYSGMLQEILGGQPTFEEVFPEKDPYVAPTETPTKLDDKITAPVETYLGTIPDVDNVYIDRVSEGFEYWADILTGKQTFKEVLAVDVQRWKDFPQYLKEYNIYGEKINGEEEKEIIEKKQVGLTLGKVLKPEPYVYKTKDTGIAGIARTVSRYGEQRPGYLATGAYERMSGAFQVLGPTHAGSKYYEQVGYKKGVKSSAGRARRVAAWKKKHGEPTYSGTGHRVKV